jgi:hypothetical protein
MQLYKGNISFCKSILVCSLGIILGTPVFADYHLLILLSPILVSLYYERDLSPSRDQESLKPVSARKSFFSDQNTHHVYCEVLSKADGFMIVFLTVPKVLPIVGSLGSIQTFLNPLAICIYLALTIANPNMKRLKVQMTR